MRLGFKKVTVTDAGTSNPIPLNYRNIHDSAVGLSLDCTSGEATVEFTLNDIQNGDSPYIWHEVTALGTVTSDVAAAILSHPASAVRLNVTTGPVVLRIREAI